MTSRKNTKTKVDRSAAEVVTRVSNAVGISFNYKENEVTRGDTSVISGSAKTLKAFSTPQGSNVIYASGPQSSYTPSGPRPVYSTPGPRSTYSTSGSRPVYSTSGPRPVYSTSGPRPVYSTSGPRLFHSKSGPKPAYPTSVPSPSCTSSGHRQAYISPDARLASKASYGNSQNDSKQDLRRGYASSSTSSNVGEVDKSVVSLITTSSSSDPKDKALIKKKKTPVKVKVTYVTKQIYIQPRYPILTVERLKNLEHHVDLLTVTLGRVPKVYKHGKCVRFVPETNDEYKTMQRYLAKIESEERIAWCSYAVPPGNSLKVNETIRVVERIKIAEELKNLKLDDKTKTSDTKQADAVQKDVKSVANNENKHIKTTKLPSKDEQVIKVKSELEESKHGDTAPQNQLSTSNQRHNGKTSTEQQRTIKDTPVLNITTRHDSNIKRQSADVTKQTFSTNTGNKVRKAPEAAANDIYSPDTKPGPIGIDKKLNFVSVIRTQKMF